MARKTVTITTLDCPAPRDFHIDEAKAERFAAKVRSEGGTAVIGPLKLSPALAAMLDGAGVDVAAVA